MLKQFTEWAKTAGWKIKIERQSMETLPEEITDRYAIPAEYKQFLSQVAGCINNTETKWFLCLADYQPQSEDSFRWNEFEYISLEAAESDEKRQHLITSFWNVHMPFIMSVDNGYSYYAFNVQNGSVVFGDEPEFEETRTVAKSFNEFLAKVISKDIVL